MTAPVQPAGVVAPRRSGVWPAVLCFITFGVLMPLTRPAFSVWTFLWSILLALVIAALTLSLLLASFHMGTQQLRQYDQHFARNVVGAGMIFMIPFAVLAALALIAFGWDAIMPFASAAVTTGAAAAGTEAMTRGARGLRLMIVPTVIAMIFSTIWMVLITFIP